MAKIKKIVAREILDSRGNPTVEAKVVLANNAESKASVPSGASTGVHEACELRDGDKKRYNGKGVLQAVNNINTKIAPKLKSKDVSKQRILDDLMIKLDGTDNKKNLGANAILAVSLAIAKAGAKAEKIELYEYLVKTYKLNKTLVGLPTPSFNIFNGGKHADTNLDFQEFMILPLANTDFSSVKRKKKLSFAEMVRMGAEIFHELGHVLKDAGFDTDVGNEGGYAPDIVSSIQAIELILAAVIHAGYKPGEDIGLGMDVGSSELYNPKNKQYVFKLDNAHFTSDNLLGLYHEWFRKYPLISVEDGLAEDDWEGWRELTKELGSEMLIIGDDLFVTNVARLRRGIKEKAGNSILIKPNQIGSVSETIDTVNLAQKHNYKIMMSHRSGETCDNYIADMAVAVGAEFIKSGSLSRGERLAKYNRLMEIELLLNKKY